MKSVVINLEKLIPDRPPNKLAALSAYVWRVVPVYHNVGYVVSNCIFQKVRDL